LSVYVVLAILFASLLHPFTILFSLPLSITGAIAGLLIMSLPITLPVVIGFLMLMGIVTKNAIMLLDFAIEGMHAGLERTAAIMDAGRKRARPIIMTTVAMVAGMLPSAFAWGAGGEFRSPMAIAVIGGLVVSTLLSLLFVPALFTIMDDFGRLLWRIFGRFVGKADEPLSPGGATKAPIADVHPGPEIGHSHQSLSEAAEPREAGLTKPAV
jgi:multidrug efflux pump subunit AcrB